MGEEYRFATTPLHHNAQQTILYLVFIPKPLAAFRSFATQQNSTKNKSGRKQKCFVVAIYIATSTFINTSRV